MVTQELAVAVMQERMREAAEFRRQKQARQGQGASPRRALSGLSISRLPLPSFMARGFRTASVQ